MLICFFYFPESLLFHTCCVFNCTYHCTLDQSLVVHNRIAFYLCVFKCIHLRAPVITQNKLGTPRPLAFFPGNIKRTHVFRMNFNIVSIHWLRAYDITVVVFFIIENQNHTYLYLRATLFRSGPKQDAVPVVRNDNTDSKNEFFLSFLPKKKKSNFWKKKLFVIIGRSVGHAEALRSQRLFGDQNQ